MRFLFVFFIGLTPFSLAITIPKAEETFSKPGQI